MANVSKLRWVSGAAALILLLTAGVRAAADAIFVTTAVNISKIASDGTVSTFIAATGDGPTGNHLNGPFGLAADAASNLYVINVNNGVIVKVAPNAVATVFYDAATTAGIFNALAVDTAGNVHVVENSHTMVRITPTGSVTVEATGLNDPFATVFDSAGNIYTDSQDGTVLKIEPGGATSVFASGFNMPTGLAFDSHGDLFVASFGDNTIAKVTSSGAVSTFATGLSGPNGIAFDSIGNLYVANISDGTFAKVTPGGNVTPFAGGFFQNTDVVAVPTPEPTCGALILIATLGLLSRRRRARWERSRLLISIAGGKKLPGWGCAVTVLTLLAIGNLAQADVLFVTALTAVDKITGDGTVSTFVAQTGDGPNGNHLNQPLGLAIDSAANLYVTNGNSDAIVRITPAGATSVFSTTSATSGEYGGLAIDSAGNAFVAGTNLHAVLKINPAGQISTFAGGFIRPQGVALDGLGNVFVSDSGNNTIVKLTSTGVASQFASSLDGSQAMAFGPDGNLYFGSGNSIVSVTPGGVASTFATVASPGGLAFGSGGSLYVISGGPSNSILRVDPDGAIATVATGINVPIYYLVAASTPEPSSFAIVIVIGSSLLGRRHRRMAKREGLMRKLWKYRLAGRVVAMATLIVASVPVRADVLYVADGGEINKVAADGSITNFVLPTGDGPMGNHLNGPLGIAADKAGNLYVSNLNNFDIVKITPDAHTSVLFSGFSDGVTTALAIDASGNFYLAKPFQNYVVESTPAGVAVRYIQGLNKPFDIAVDSAGNLFIANNGDNTVAKVAPDGTTSTFASGLNQPGGLAFDKAGNLYIANSGDNDIVKVTSGGNVSIFASGLNGAGALAFDSSGELFACGNGGTINRIDSGGNVTPFASGLGNGGVSLVAVPTPEPSLLGAFLISSLVFFGRPTRMKSYRKRVQLLMLGTSPA